MRYSTFQLWMLIFLLGFLACGPEFIDQPERIVIRTDTPVRSGPGMEYSIITNINAGRELFLLESKNDWHKVELPDGKTGWIFRGITNSVAHEKIITIRDARVRRGPGEEYSAFALVKKGKTLDSRGMRGNWFIVDLTDGNSGWISKKDAEKTSYRNLTVTETAKIYRSPNSNSLFLLNVKPGTELIQLDKENNYYMIRLPGGDTGWIHQKYVNIIKERTILVKTRAYIRTGPEIGYDTIATVDVGARLTLLSQRENWYEIRTPRGDVGWIHKDFISTTYSSSYGGTMIEEQPVYVLTNQECNIRQGYSTTYHVIERVKKGTLLLKIGEKNNWLRIKMPNERIGWIREDLIEYSVNILLTNEKCNIRRGYSTDFRRIREVSKGTPLVKISSRKDWTRVHLVDGEIGWIKNSLFTPLDSLLFANQDCNVRKGSGTGYEIIARITYGSPVKYINTDSNWYKIELPKSNKTGYVRNDLLNKTGNEYLTNERCNIRQGPSTAFQLIRNVPKNTRLKKLAEDKDWYRVKLSDGKIGWIKNELVSHSYYPVPGYRFNGLLQQNSGSIAAENSSVPQPADDTNFNYEPNDFGIFETPGKKAETVIAIKFRTDPDLNASIITELPPGTSLKQIDKAGEWYEVLTTEGTYGWVHQSAFGIQETKYLYVKNWANIRKGPSTNYQVVDKVLKDEELLRLDKRDNWYNVKLPNGKKGWVRDNLVVIQKIMPAIDLDIKSKPAFATAETMMETEMYKGPSTAYPIIKNLPAKTVFTVISEYNGWSEIELYNKQKGWVNNKKIQQKFHSQIIAIRNAEVHATSSSQSDIIGNLKKGETTKPFDEKEGWYRIYLTSKGSGWISSSDVKKLKYPAVYVKTKTANIREMPNINSGKIAVIKEGVKLNPIDYSNDWLFVKLPRGDKGWIKQTLVNRQQHPWIVTQKDVEVYEKPTAGSLVKGKVIKDEKFLALEKNDNWYKILIRGSNIAWIYAGFVKEQIKGTQLVKDKSDLRMGAGLDYRIIETVPKSEQAKWLDEDGQWKQIQVSSGEVGWILDVQTKSVPMKTVVANRNTHAYDKPGYNNTMIGRILKNNKYTPLEKKDNWYRIQLSDGKFGWVDVEVFASPKTRTVFTLDVANIYEKASTDSKVLQKLEPATDLAILDSDGEFYLVELSNGGIRGYVKKELIFE